MYVFGFTDLETGDTFIEEVYFDTFDYGTFCLCVSSALKKEYIDISPEITDGSYQKDYVFQVNESKDRILVKQKIVSKGYIYNSSKFRNKYSFFFNKLRENYIDEISVSSIIEDYKNITISEEPVDFLKELKEKVDAKSKEQRNIVVESNFSPKNVLQEELNVEILLRKKRKEKRDRKLVKRKHR